MGKYPVIVLAQQTGMCVSVFTESVAHYGEWIKGEGADVCLYRSLKGNRLIGTNLPLSKAWNGRVVGTSLVDDWNSLDVDQKLDTIYAAVDSLLRAGLFNVVDYALGFVDINDIDIVLCWLTVTYP